MDTIVEGYRAALNLLEIDEPLNVVAHSMGGLEAVLWAQTYPKEMHCLIGLDISIPPLVLEMGVPGLFERNLNYMLGASGLARFIPEKDLHETMPILTMDTLQRYRKRSDYNLVSCQHVQPRRRS